jgi:sporulation protein YlmC with PRC-barrel domain
MDAASLRELEIISVAQANRLGKVSEVLFEIDPLRVAALRASGDEGEFVISIERVSRFGPDAVMVEKPSVRELARAPRASERTLEELTQLKVVDEDGKGLGTVRTIEFDPDSGTVERIVAGESGMLGLGGMTATIAARAVRGVGTDLLTVASSGEAAESGHDTRDSRDVETHHQDEVVLRRPDRGSAE